MKLEQNFWERTQIEPNLTFAAFKVDVYGVDRWLSILTNMILPLKLLHTAESQIKVSRHKKKGRCGKSGQNKIAKNAFCLTLDSVFSLLPFFTLFSFWLVLSFWHFRARSVPLHCASARVSHLSALQVIISIGSFSFLANIKRAVFFFFVFLCTCFCFSLSTLHSDSTFLCLYKLYVYCVRIMVKYQEIYRIVGKISAIFLLHLGNTKYTV